ncbi:meiotic nuclear division protein 1 [Lyophyllum atratum]|nr:meiotic nuclear division protein 1 [Lyophyllum atratum]
MSCDHDATRRPFLAMVAAVILLTHNIEQMAPRGLSAEEKRVRLLEIFHETKDFYQLKELEKLGPKMKGIVSQSVKEVLQSLVDDGLVQGDKIGSSNFFWSFPSQQGAMIQARLSSATEIRDTQREQLAEIRECIQTERSARPDSETRSQALAQLADLRKQVVAFEKELAAYGDCDPVKVEETRRAVFLAKEAALRWTDNYGTLLAHFTRQNGVDPAEIRKFLDIDEEYEDIC